MKFVSKVKTIILNNSIKTNLLSLYSTIVIIMSLMLLTMLFYSIELNRTYNKILSNFQTYNKISSQVNAIDKNIYLNITEQKKFESSEYATTIMDINKELAAIAQNFDKENGIESVEILKRTVNTLSKSIGETELLIKHNANYATREAQLALITRTNDIIKDNVQELMALNLTQSQKHISEIKSSYNLVLAVIILLFFGSILASVAFLLFVLQDSLNKINVVSENANKLANGDLSIDQLYFSKSSEFQVLAQSFNKMKNNIKDYINQLSSSEMRVSSILNTLNDCIVTTNSKGEIESCNAVTEKIFEYIKEELVGQNISKLISAIDFSDYSEDMFDTQKLIQNVKLIDNKYQLYGLKKSGIVFPVEVSYNEVRLEEQSVTTFVIHDITEHKNVEKMKNEFVSIVSHELRTPLTSLNGALGLISSGTLGEVSQSIKKMLSIAVNNCNRLTDLINDMLDLEKIESGKMEYDNEITEIMPLVEQSINDNSTYAMKYDVALLIVNSLPDTYVNVDKKAFGQILGNLLSNACKFSEAGRNVEISVTKEDSQVRIAVKNYGPEIPDSFKPLIFQKFTQGDSSDSRDKGGTGLGLSISKALIEKMDGAISFTSQNNVTTFFVDLPSVSST